MTIIARYFYLAVLTLLTASCATSTAITARKAAKSLQGSGLDADCVTVDYTPGDKALDNVRNLNLVHPQWSHVSTKVVGSNFTTCTAPHPGDAKELTIVGHGGSGVIITGGGTGQPNDYVWVGTGPDNEKVWQDGTNGLVGFRRSDGRTAMVSLFSCNTANGNRGRTLMNDLVYHLGLTVRARNGLVFTKKGGITFQPNSCWVYVKALADSQMQVPDCSPKPPSPSRSADKRKSIANLGFDITDVKKVEARNITRGIVFGPWITVTGSARFDLVSEIVSEEKVQEGTPLAIQTGVLKLTIENIGDREFIVWNDLLLEDSTHPETYYYVTPKFADRFRGSFPEPP